MQLYALDPTSPPLSLCLAVSVNLSFSVYLFVCPLSRSVSFSKYVRVLSIQSSRRKCYIHIPFISTESFSSPTEV